MSAPTPSRHTVTCSLSFSDSAVMCRESLRNDYVSNRSTFRSWKHSWTTWSEKESPHPSTRNHRLSALHAFFRYVQAEEPARMHQCQKILAIPLRKHARPTVGYLSKEDLAEILAQPDLRAPEGRRDAVLLSVLYDVGARVQELTDLSVGDVRLDSPAQLRLLGKGRKMRAVPLMGKTVQLLHDHIQENCLLTVPNSSTSLSSRTHASNDCRVRESVTSFTNITSKHETSVRV